MGPHGEQQLVLFYAVAVFLSFLMELLTMARFAWQDGQIAFLLVNVLAVAGVTFTVGVNLLRVYPLASLIATAVVGWCFTFYGRARKDRRTSKTLKSFRSAKRVST